MPLSEKAPIFNENPPIVGRPQDSGTRRTLYGNYGGADHHKHNPYKLHDLPVLKRVADRVLETAKKTVVGGVRWSCTILDMAEISSYDHTPQHLHRDAPPYTIPEGTLIVNCLIMLTHNHEEEDGSHLFLCPPAVRGSLTLGWRGLCHSLVVPRLNLCLRLQCLGSFPVFVFVKPWTGLSSLMRTNKGQPRSGWQHKPNKFKNSESNSPEWQ